MHFHTSQHITFSHFPIDTATTRLETPKTNFRLSTTKSYACHAKCTFTRHNTSPFLTPHRHRDDAIRDPKNKLSLECHKVPCLPREMHFHTSQHITFSHFPIDTATTRLETPKTNFRLSATKSHACHVNALSHVTTHHLFSLPRRHRDDAIRDPKNKLSLEYHKVLRLPREIHFHTSQHITFSHSP